MCKERTVPIKADANLGRTVREVASFIHGILLAAIKERNVCDDASNVLENSSHQLQVPCMVTKMEKNVLRQLNPAHTYALGHNRF